MNTLRVFLAVLAFSLIASFQAQAQTWPSRPVTLVVGFAPGVGPDAIARFLADRLTESTGQKFIVENRPGAFAMLSAQHVAHAQPNGYTVLLSTVSAAMNGSLFKTIAYDPVKDFTPVTSLAMAAFILVVNPNTVPVNSVNELTQYIKAHPDKLAYGVGGTAIDVASTLYLSLAGIRRDSLTRVSYKGAADALPDLIAGRIHFTFLDSAFGVQQAHAGKVRALAITGTRRTGAAPEIPPMAETLPGFDLVGWYALFLPANTPRDIAKKLAELSNAAMGTDKAKEFLRTYAMDPYPSDPENFSLFFSGEISKWGKLIRESGIEPQ